MKTYILIIMLLTITIFGCGEEDGEQATAVTPQTVPATTAIVATRELVSTAEFDFFSSAKLTLTLPPAPTATVAYFINICTDFSNENNVITINYQSCKLRTIITAQEQEFTLSLSVAELKLIAQIWPIEHNAQAITAYWDIAESGRHWQIVF